MQKYNRCLFVLIIISILLISISAISAASDVKSDDSSNIMSTSSNIQNDCTNDVMIDKTIKKDDSDINAVEKDKNIKKSTISVSTYDELKNAIELNDNDKTINLQKKTYYINQPVTTNANANILINGNGALIDGSNTYQFLTVFTNSNITINNLTIINTCSSDDNAAAIVVDENANLILDYVNFTNNGGGLYGGAITSNSMVIATNCVFENNHAMDGGSIYLNNSKESNLNYNIYRNNYAGEGAAIYLNNTNHTIIANSSFINNEAEMEGGALCAYNANYTKITTNEFINNSALMGAGSGEGEGGAISISGAYNNITYNNFTGNYAWIGSAIKNGAVYDEEGNANPSLNTIIHSNNFEENKNPDYGDDSVVYVHANNVKITRNNFTNNTVRNLKVSGKNNTLENNIVIDNIIRLNGTYNKITINDYAGAYNNTIINNSVIKNLTNYGTLKIINSTIKNVQNANYIINNQGKLYLINTTIQGCNNIKNIIFGVNIEILNCTFINNTVSEYVIKSNNKQTDPLIINNTLFDNTGSIYFGNIPNSTITYNQFNHTAGMYGSITLEKCQDTDINHNLFINNWAEIGGAIYVSNSNHTIIANSTFRNNKAWNEGGAICIYNSNYTKITTDEFIKSASIDGGGSGEGTGGAIYMTGSYNNITYCNFTGNDAWIGSAILISSGSNNIIHANNFTGNTNNGDYLQEKFKFVVYISGNDTKLTKNTFNNNEFKDFEISGTNNTIKSNIIKNKNISTFADNTAYTNSTFDNVTFTAWFKTTNDTIIKNSKINNITNLGNLKLINCTFKNVNSKNVLIYNKGNLSIINSTIDSCTAVKNLVFGANITEITNSKFTNNAINANQKTCDLFVFANTKITNCLFKNNKGGVKATSVTITNTTFESNVKNNTDYDDHNGGALITTGTSKIVNSVFNKNSINTNMTKIGLGGALYNNGTLTITNSKFNANVANKGGAVYNNGIITSTNTNYTNCKATEGGAIFNAKTYNVTNATFTQNVAQNNGGSIYNSATMIIKDSRLYKSNATTKYGGAIFNSGILTLTNNKITLNKASYGAVVYSTKKVTLTNNNIYNNTATVNGIICSKGNLTAKNNNFTSNKANSYGGAIYNLGNATIQSNIFKNSYDKIKSSIYNKGTASITYNTFSNSLSIAIKNDGGKVTQSNNKVQS